VLCAVGVWFVFSMLSSFMDVSIPVDKYDQTIITNTSIVSLSDGSLTRGGGFFLGSGSFDSRMYFIYYEGSTSFKLKRIDAEYSTIYMDENEHPYISTTVFTMCYKYRNGKLSCSRDYYHHNEYAFHIPSGSIIKSYTLDGEL
jgi:hypothetical protein